MCVFMVAILSIACTIGGAAFRIIGINLSSIAFLISGVIVETPPEIVEYGQRIEFLGSIIFVIGMIGSLYTLYLIHIKNKR